MASRPQINVRYDDLEKEAFKEAAMLSGLSFSAWLRQRLREAAEKELKKAGRKVPFLK